MILAPRFYTGLELQSLEPKAQTFVCEVPPAVVHDTTCLTNLRPPLHNIGPAPQNVDRRWPADSCQRRLEKDAKPPHAVGLRRQPPPLRAYYDRTAGVSRVSVHLPDFDD